MACNEFRVTIVSGNEVGCGQHRQVMVPRGLPYVLDRPDLVRQSMIYIEGVQIPWRMMSGTRVHEPVRRIRHVVSRSIENRPTSGNQIVGCTDERVPRRSWNHCRIDGTERCWKGNDV